MSYCIHLTTLTSGEASYLVLTCELCPLTCLLSPAREGHSTIVEEISSQLRGITPDLVVVSVGGGGLMNGVLHGMHSVGWDEVPLLAMETEGAHSFYACAQANEWVELDDITRYVVTTSTLHGLLSKLNPLLPSLPPPFPSVARCLGAKRVCKRSFEWLSQHPIIPHKISDREAIAACIKLAG